MSKCYLNVLLETVIDILFYLMVNQWMANMRLLFETKQQQQTVLWWLSHEFGVVMFSPAWMICMLICVPDFNHLPYFCGIWIYCDMVTYLAQLLSVWKCNCFINACNCCNCLLVPLLEFGVTSPALSGTRWAVRLLFYVIRPLPQCYPTCLPPLFWQQVYKFHAIILALRNHHSHY